MAKLTTIVMSIFGSKIPFFEYFDNIFVSITASVHNGVHPALSITFKSMFLQILKPITDQ